MRSSSRRPFLLFAAVFSTTLAATSWARAADTVTIFAAASLKNAIDGAAAAYKAKTGTEIRTSYAGSSTLAKQIEKGAPADIFASADIDWMAYLEKRDLIQPGSRKDLLGNTLVVVANAKSPVTSLELTPGAFDKAVGDGRWTTGTVTSVPCGIYAKEALTQLGIWSVAEPKLAQTADVRAALTFVSKGEASLGVVYQTDANVDKGVKVVATFPEDSHAPIVYPFALTKAAEGQAPRQFLTFLEGPEGRVFFEKQGFKLLAAQP